MLSGLKVKHASSVKHCFKCKDTTSSTASKKLSKQSGTNWPCCQGSRLSMHGVEHLVIITTHRSQQILHLLRRCCQVSEPSNVSTEAGRAGGNSRASAGLLGCRLLLGLCQQLF